MKTTLPIGSFVQTLHSVMGGIWVVTDTGLRLLDVNELPEDGTTIHKCVWDTPAVVGKTNNPQDFKKLDQLVPYETFVFTTQQ
jgi:hypothetical protein